MGVYRNYPINSKFSNNYDSPPSSPIEEAKKYIHNPTLSSPEKSEEDE